MNMTMHNNNQYRSHNYITMQNKTTVNSQIHDLLYVSVIYMYKIFSYFNTPFLRDPRKSTKPIKLKSIQP